MRTDEIISEVGISESVPDAVIEGLIADMREFDEQYQDHPQHPLATHVVAMLGAVTCAMAKGDPDGIDAPFGAGTLEHRCAYHLEAAVWLISRAFRSEGMTVQDVAQAIVPIARDAIGE